MAKIGKLTKKIVGTFFGVESAEEMKKKGIVLSLVVPALRGFEWFLLGLTAGIVGFLKYYNVPEWGIFVILWFGNMAICGGVIFANDKTEVDLTLMEGLRRLINAGIEKSKVSGLIIETLIIVRLIIWDGPDRFVIFFRSRLNSQQSKVAIFVIASAIQMAIWTAIYVAGYENFSEVFKSLFR